MNEEVPDFLKDPETENPFTGTEEEMQAPFPGTFIARVKSIGVVTHEDSDRGTTVIDRVWMRANIADDVKQNKICARGMDASITFWPSRAHQLVTFCKEVAGDKLNKLKEKNERASGKISWVDIEPISEETTGVIADLIGFPFLCDIFENDKGYATIVLDSVKAYPGVNIKTKDEMDGTDFKFGEGQ